MTTALSKHCPCDIEEGLPVQQLPLDARAVQGSISPHVLSATSRQRLVLTDST